MAKLIPDAQARPATPERAFFVDEISVNEFVPAGVDRPTEVHLLLTVRGLPAPIVLRLKSPPAADRLIAMLTRHRQGVWGGGEG